jgi:hypothetical protein
MEFGGAGTAVMIAIAALLWFLYLMPTWMKRREAQVAEEAARRRVMVGVDPTLAPEVERLAGSATPPPVVRVAVPSPPEELRRRQRRARRLAAGLLLASVVALVVQGWILTTTAATVASWAILAAAATGVIVSISVQRRLDARQSMQAPAAARPRRRTSASVDVPLDAAGAAPAEEWTPVPVPKPLYLSRPEVQRITVPSVDSATLLRAAAAEAERALRAAQAEPEVAELRPASPPSRYAAMGMLDERGVQTPDLDEVLRRRRNAG